MLRAYVKFYADYWRGIWSTPRRCNGCAQVVPWTANFCPNCGSSDIAAGARQGGWTIAGKLALLAVMLAGNAALLWLLYMAAHITVDWLYVVVLAMLRHVVQFIEKLTVLLLLVLVPPLFFLALMLGPKGMATLVNNVKRTTGGVRVMFGAKPPDEKKSKSDDASSKS